MLLERLPHAVVAFSSDGLVLYANTEACRLAGVASGTMTGRAVDAWLAAGTRLFAGEHWARFLDTQAAQGVARLANLRGRDRVAEYSAVANVLPGVHVATVRGLKPRLRLHGTRSRLLALLDATPDLVGVFTAAGLTEYLNPSGLALLGVPALAAVRGQPLTPFHPNWALELLQRSALPVVQERGVWTGETALLRRDGTEIPVSQVLIGHRDRHGELRHVSTICRDVRAQRQAAETLRQGERRRAEARKMEALTVLAGGVAHDFNNLLTVINGYCALLQAQVPADGPVREMLDEVADAGARAADLAGQLLAIGSRRLLRTQVVDLNAAVRSLEPLMRHTLGDRIRLDVPFAEEPLPIRAESNQLQQSLMSLVINARDAMPEGGALTITTVLVPPTDTDFSSLSPRVAWVELSATDTGTGMSEEVRSRALEPFFTTKPRGQGSGLGLALTYGMLHQLGGEIDITSQPEAGTTVRLRFPLAAEPVAEPDAPLPDMVELAGSETVLVVEDEPSVREWTRRVLESYGYAVLTAEDGVAALEALQREATRVQLLLTDLAMPRLGGRELAEEATERWPWLRVLLMTGHTDDNAILTAAGHPIVIRKPFSPLELARAVRLALQ